MKKRRFGNAPVKLSISKSIKLPFSEKLPQQCAEAVQFFIKNYPMRVETLITRLNNGEDVTKKAHIEQAMLKYNVQLLLAQDRETPDDHPAKARITEYLTKYMEMSNLVAAIQSLISLNQLDIEQETPESYKETTLCMDLWIEHFDYQNTCLLKFLYYLLNPSQKDQFLNDLTFHTKLTLAQYKYLNETRGIPHTDELKQNHEDREGEIGRAYLMTKATHSIITTASDNLIADNAQVAHQLLGVAKLINNLEPLAHSVTTITQLVEQLPTDPYNDVLHTNVQRASAYVNQATQQFGQLNIGITALMAMLENIGQTTDNAPFFTRYQAIQQSLTTSLDSLSELDKALLEHLPNNAQLGC